jgi:formate hydrogenlyase subunit 3/multisubunit Na+/H+ antiporter MnhD subunit
MFGMALIEHLEKTLTISQICVPLGGIGSIAFVFMMIGAVSKAGAVPFHSWISDAAGETPLAFTAFLPGSLSRLLGIYFLARMTSEMFRFSPCSRVAWLIVALGIASLGIGLFFAPAQKEPKKLLGFISIALCGVLLVSIGSGLSGNPLHTAVLIAGSTILFTLVFLVVGVQEQRCATFTTALSMRVRNITPFKALYERSDQGQFDPYELAMIVFNFFAKTAFALDRFTNWIYDGFIPFCAVMLSTIIRVFHTGNYAAYIIWSLAGTVTVIAFMIK